MTKRQFFIDESGAAVTDWVALTAGIMLLGMAVVFKIYEDGVTPALQRSIDSANATANQSSAVRTSASSTTSSSLNSN